MESELPLDPDDDPDDEDSSRLARGGMEYDPSLDA